MTMSPRVILDMMREYCDSSTIHGLRLLVAKKRHFFERIFWLFFIAIAISGAIGLILSNWQHYVENPTVVSLEKDFRNWHNPFPAATGCYVERADEDLTNRYIKKQWNINETHEKYNYYLDFVKVVVNISYETMDSFVRFQGDETLNGIDYLNLALEVHPLLTGDLVSFDVSKNYTWSNIITEFGLCFSTNNKFIDLLIAERKKNETKYMDEDLLECHYLNGLCYARFDSEPYAAIKYFIHSPYEVIHTTTNAPILLPERSELEINYAMMETRPMPALRRLSVSQRQCRFYDESISTEMKGYNTGICHILCRYRYAMRMCGCKPYFYHEMSGKTCDIKGMICLSKYKDYFTQKANKMGCKCDEPCHVITYFPQIPKLSEWATGYFDQRVTFRWGLLHPTTRYNRNVLFAFEDLVVSFGGTASLFFGMSFLSIVEFLFFVIKKVILCLFGRKIKRTANKDYIKGIAFGSNENVRRITRADRLFITVKPTN